MSNNNENEKRKQCYNNANRTKKKNKKGTTLTLSELLIGKQVIPQVYEKQAKRPLISTTDNSKGDESGAQNKQHKENENLSTTSSVKESCLNSTSSNCNPRQRSRSPPVISRSNGGDKWHAPKHGNDLRSARAGNNVNPNRSSYYSSWRNSESLRSDSNGYENWNVAKERRQTSNYSSDQRSRQNPISGTSGYARPLYGGGGFSNRPWQQQPRNVGQPPCPPSQYRPRSNNWDDEERNYRL